MAISPYMKRLRAKVGRDMVMTPGVCAFVFDAQGRLLLQRTRDTGTWQVIGGSIDPGESPADCAEREVLEEAGIRATVERVAGVYGGPLVTYPNGDKTMYTTIAFLCRAIDQIPRVADDESLEVRFFDLEELPPIPLDQQRQLTYIREGNPQAFFDRGGAISRDPMP